MRLPKSTLILFVVALMGRRPLNSDMIEKDGATVVIDNGSFECKAGYQGDMALRFPNKFYKLKDHISFDYINGYAEKFMFDNDVITNFENMEIIFDRVFSKIKLMEPSGLVLTERPFTPNFSRKRVLETVFELYRFRKLQLGIDAVYSMHQNKVHEPAAVISLSHSSTDVIFVDKKIRQVFRLGFGGKQCKKYIAMMLCNRYPRLRVSDEIMDEMLKNLKACEEYDRECLNILECTQKKEFVDDYMPSFLQGSCPEENADSREIRSVSRGGNMLGNDVHDSRGAKDKKCEDKSAEDVESRRIREYARTPLYCGETYTHGNSAKIDKNTSVNTDSRLRQDGGEYDEDPGMEDAAEKDDAANTDARDDERKDRIAYFSLIYRLKQRVAKELGRLSGCISSSMDRYEIKTDFHGYLERKKNKLHLLKRDLKQRENILREVKNKKSVFAKVKGKSTEALLSKGEEEIFSRVLWAEDEENHSRILKDIKECTETIRQHVPDFEPFEIPTSRFLQGVSIERRKIPEILFEPSIINLNGVGLSEILEILRARNIFITGGFSQVAGLDTRIRFEAQSLVSGGILNVQRAKDPVYDAFFGAHFAPLFPVFTLKDYEELGAEYLVERMEF